MKYKILPPIFDFDRYSFITPIPAIVKNNCILVDEYVFTFEDLPLEDSINVKIIEEDSQFYSIPISERCFKKDLDKTSSLKYEIPFSWKPVIKCYEDAKSSKRYTTEHTVIHLCPLENINLGTLKRQAETLLCYPRDHNNIVDYPATTPFDAGIITCKRCLEFMKRWRKKIINVRLSGLEPEHLKDTRS